MSARGPVRHTCPIIDDCIHYVQRALDDPEEVACLADLIGGNGILEDIRSANAALRDWGAEQEDLATNLEWQVKNLSSELGAALSEIAALKDELSTMEAA